MTLETKIRVLPESISCQIAAGEIVDRPASVVKELVDNSIDAGSSMITVDVLNGGKQLIRVTDNGEGMTRADAQLACQRFATSKLSNADDLLSISTFGFRGEALPSISSISKFRLLTATRGDSVGTELVADGGPITSVKDHASNPGTRVEVGELFFNTPGRQKFLKTTATEFSHICHVVQQAALARPSSQFRLMHNGNVVFDFPGVGSMQERLLQLYGTKFMNLMLPVEFEHGTVKVKGIAIHPGHSRTSRTPQELFVNGRAVKNTTISHAIYEAYGSFLPKGRHPLFAILVEIDPREVDVNVHPAKREVKFSAPDVVHRVVKEAVRRPLQRKSGMMVGPERENLKGGETLEHKQRDTISESSGPHLSPLHPFETVQQKEGTPKVPSQNVVHMFSEGLQEGETAQEARPSYLIAYSDK